MADPLVICYASLTGTERNLKALAVRGWGLFISRGHKWRQPWYLKIARRFRIAADNGAWADHQAGRDFDEDEFEQFLQWIEDNGLAVDFLVLPDIVAGGLKSLALSLRYMNRCLSVAPLVLIPVQDGMTIEDLKPYVGPNVGIFLGGSTQWKLATMRKWGDFCAERGLKYHVARVNSAIRMYAAIGAKADSTDGTSASQFAVTIAKLDNASRQLDFWGAS